MPVILLLLVLHQGLVKATPSEDEWYSVPAFAVQEVQVEDEGWIMEGIRRSSGDRVRATARRVRAGTLELLVSDFDHETGFDVHLQLSYSEAGRISARARSTWYADVGKANSGPYLDLHGRVMVEMRALGDPDPLRVSFRLHGIQVGVIDTAEPMMIQGAVEIPLSAQDRSVSVTDPVLREAHERVPESELREVFQEWPDGSPRAHGWQDASGFRQGLWTTWYSDGKKQSVSRFMFGDREGNWLSYWRDGLQYEEGQFKQGVRTGKWVETWRYQDQITTRAGNYVRGRKDGEWIERWEDMSFRVRGSYKEGREVGRWTGWWRNGNKRWEGEYEDGEEVGAWTYWNEDGSVRETVLRRRWRTGK